jgi:hypothetical protein
VSTTGKERLVRLNSLARLLTIGILLPFSCAGRSEWGADREALFVIATSGATQGDHPCQQVRDAEFSLRTGFLTKSMADTLRQRIAEAELGDVQDCLKDVEAYNQCFLDLSCDAFTGGSGAVPAWALGANTAPCACGVVRAPFGGPLSSSLASCVGILPVSVGPPRPGFACPS